MRTEQALGDAEAAARRGAELIAEAAAEALAARGGFSFALSGGSSPLRMFELLANHEIDWERVDVFQVDERVAPDGDPERNLTQLRAHLPDAAVARLRPMPVTDDDLKTATASYESALPDALDLIHLGLGPDGHTASLVPGDPVLDVRDRRVALTGGEYQGRRRMTLTYPGLAASRRLFWLVTGDDKHDALEKLVAEDPSIPAGRVEAPGALVITDRAG